ncbi:MAG: hypothetical protein K5921_09325 [Lachnospiraceae bacterium]|nr:hypothetical protein [Lachnospiraceae bacterium]
MKNKKQGNNWTAYYDHDTNRYFAEIMYTSREGREQYDYEITKEIYDRLGSFGEDYENEELIREGEIKDLSRIAEKEDERDNQFYRSFGMKPISEGNMISYFR